MTPEEYISRLIEISEKKHQQLLEMLQLTKKQIDSITEDKLESLQTIVDEKQKIIDKIDKLDEQFEVYFNRLKSELNIMSLDELESPYISGTGTLKEKISLIMDTVKEITCIEKNNNNRANELLSKLGQNIKNINQGKRVNSAYKPVPIQIPSYYMDKKK